MIKVLTSGFLTSIQDLGRKGHADIGVPISGVMDQYSAKLANAILHNNANDAVLEIAFSNCKLAFKSETYICVSGANFSAKINDKSITINTSVKVLKDDVLSFGKQYYGVRTYVAVLGGFQTENVLNSKSFYQGITNASVIKKGELLPINVLNKVLETTFSAVKTNQKHFNAKEIECFKGPEFNLLSQMQQNKLLKTEFTISKENNRMAYQLNEPIENDLKDILTSSVLPGTVQLTPSGKLIVLMRDCQVTGGYPRVLVLAKEAINQLAQKTTNDLFKFELIN